MLWCVCCAGAFKFVTKGLDKLDTLKIEGKLGEFAQVKIVLDRPCGPIKMEMQRVLVAKDLNDDAKRYDDVKGDGQGKY